MSNVDEFESIFRSALKDRFVLEHNPPKTILILTDLNEAETEKFSDDVQKFLRVYHKENPAWVHISGDDYDNMTDLLFEIKRHKPDLICTYRNLKSDAWNFPHSLGEYVDVLTQATLAPIFIMPHPKADYASKHSMQQTQNVMVMSDQLSGEEKLVNLAIDLTEEGGSLFLAHLEDEFHFKRIIEAISRIATIETESAEEYIREELLKGADEFITSCQQVLKEASSTIKVERKVRFGHHLKACKKIIEANKVDVLVLNSQSDNQMAIHGFAYPLAVEIRHLPILIL